MSRFVIRTLKTGVEQLQEEPAPEPTRPLPPSKANLLTKEHDQWHQQLKTDLAMLVHNDNTMDLIEVFCSPNSRLTQTAQDAKLKAERWTLEDFDLSLIVDLERANSLLRKLRPKRLWLSPEGGPYSVMQNANQKKKTQQREELKKKQEHAFKLWQSCIELAWLQIELGGTFYIEQPKTCQSWQLEDRNTRYLLDELSSYAIRDQCVDGLTHPKTGLPMQKGTRIQTNDTSSINQFTQRCTGHDHGHSPVEGGQVVRDTALYPKRFCQRVVHIWKGDDAMTPNRILQKWGSPSCRGHTLYMFRLQFAQPCFVPNLSHVRSGKVI